MREPCSGARGLAWLVAVGSWACLAQAHAQGCGELGNGMGPFDYRTEQGSAKALVESAHFTPAVEAALRGNTSSTAGGDLDYTLRAFPNHHRALIALTKLSQHEHSLQPVGMRYSVDCWFDRAIRFRFDDLVVRMIYADFLFKGGRPQEADAQLGYAQTKAGDDAFTHYNLGLVYFDGKEYDKSLKEAQLAMQLGFTRTALRDKLQGVGKWVAPPPRPASAASAPDDAASAPLRADAAGPVASAPH